MLMSHVVLKMPPGSQCRFPSCRKRIRILSKFGMSSSALLWMGESGFGGLEFGEVLILLRV